jgi:hypothetical protein
MMEQWHQIIPKLMPLMDETAPKDISRRHPEGAAAAADEAGRHAAG